MRSMKSIRGHSLTSLFFEPTEPELAKDAPFTKLVKSFGTLAQAIFWSKF